MTVVTNIIYVCYLYCQHFQVLVYSSFNSEYGQLLGKYDGDMPLDQKFDIRMENGYARGSYVTILDERDPPSLDVAEVQVYGSKRRYSRINILIICGYSEQYMT